MFLKIRRKDTKQASTLDPVTLVIKPLDKNQFGISPAAALQLTTMLAYQSPEHQYFRVAIKGGGCSGLSIHYEFGAVRPTDLVFSEAGINLCIDKKSLGVLGGSTLHWREQLGVGEFMLLNNPAAKQCSCGQSFSL